MKYFLSISGLFLIVMLFAFGCGDDCTVCPEASHTAVAVGIIYMNIDGLHASGEILGINGLKPKIDSIIIDGEQAFIRMSIASPEAIYFNRIQSPTTHVSGDTVDFNFYTSAGVSKASVKLLQVPDDNINLISPAPGEILDLNSAVIIEWYDIENADWYNIILTYQYLDLTDAQVSDTIISCQTDTTYTVPGNVLIHDGFLSLKVRAGTGPRPDASEGNIIGGSVRGAIISYQMMGTYYQIGDGFQIAAAPPVGYTEDDNDAIFLKTMAELYIK